MDNEEADSVDLDEDFSEDLTLEISGIFSHRSSVEGWAEAVDAPEQGPISERISRCDSGYHSRMPSVGRVARLSSTAQLLVITVVASEELLRPVRPVVAKGRFVSESRPCSV